MMLPFLSNQNPFLQQTETSDECYEVKEPYCGWLQDVNIWRMPRTKDECQYFCYSDEELRLQEITFLRL